MTPNSQTIPVVAVPPFARTLAENGLAVRRGGVEILQVNLGKRCNQACTHCHVEAGPLRAEMMDRRTAERILELLARAPGIGTLDITGGAPELNPHFRYLAEGARDLGKEVIDRCNLTVLHEPGQEDLAEFLQRRRIRIVASLPCYLPGNVDRQRGKGVYMLSISALKLLNTLGYGKAGSGLILDLVYNPASADLPPDQSELEQEYKIRLREDWGIEFNRLLTLANMPIRRFAEFLHREGKLEDYMRLLASRFNPHAVAQVMCAEMVSVGWDGRLYDCDFNQMLEIPVIGARRTVWDIESFADVGTAVALDDHCYGCTAGTGSSCGGALADRSAKS
jgi:radical SAM/Cys-rich protein